MPEYLEQAQLREYEALKTASKRFESSKQGQITPTFIERDGVTYVASVDIENEGYIKFGRLDPIPAPSFLKSKAREKGDDAKGTSADAADESASAVPTKAFSKGKNPGFRIFIPPREVQTIQKKMSKSELKFHIALPDHHNIGDAEFEAEERLREQAWRIIADIIMTPPGNIKSFKLLRPTKRFCQLNKTYDPKTMQPNETQQYGKDVVIYAREDDSRTPEEWVALMKKISDALSEAGIPERLPLPEGKERKTKPLGDSPYICYRYGNPSVDEIEYRIQEALRKTQFKKPDAPHSAQMK